MADWIAALQASGDARLVAMALALFAAVMHAIFGALQKGRHDPWVSRVAIDVAYSLMALPVALFLVPRPSPLVWWLLAGAMAIHLGYKLCQATAYDRGAFTVVYPIVRGTGPLVTVAVAGIVFHEHYTLTQWLGVLMLSGGIFALAGVNLAQTRIDRPLLLTAIGWAFATGIFTAAYTTWDAYGIRAAADPFTFLAWFFALDGILFPLVALGTGRAAIEPAEIGALVRRGIIGGLVAYASFGSVMMATRIDKVGQAAVLRETSVVFAAIIGVVFLHERTTPLRAALVGLIALGAIVVEFGA